MRCYVYYYTKLYCFSTIWQVFVEEAGVATDLSEV